MRRWRTAGEAALWTVAAALAAWFAPPAINTDAASYLDLAAAWRGGDWALALNAYWSPLYVWLLALVQAVVPVAPSGEIAMLRVVNVALFWSAMTAWLALVTRVDATGDGLVWRWRVLAGLTAAWTLLRAVGVSSATPDLLASALLFVAARYLLIFDATPGVGAGLRVGLTLGLLALARAAMLPAALLLLPLVAVRSAAHRAPRSLGAIVVGLLVTAGPWMLALSLAAGRPTFGDTGRLNYAWFVNGVARYVHWQGDEAGSGRPAHPTSRVARAPDTFAFDAAWRCTYPPGCNPPYWHEGLELRFSIADHWRAIATNAGQVWWMIVRPLAGLPLAFVIAALFARAMSGSSTARPSLAPVLWLGVLPAALYALVYLETRHVAASLLLLLLPALRRLKSPHPKVALAVAVLVALYGGLLARSLSGIAQREAGADVERLLSLAVAQTAPEAGAAARIGDTGLHWARLARVRIVAEIPDARAFFDLSPDEQAARLDLLRRAGAEVVVADGRSAARPAGWRPVSGTPYLVRSAGPDHRD